MEYKIPWVVFIVIVVSVALSSCHGHHHGNSERLGTVSASKWVRNTTAIDRYRVDKGKFNQVDLTLLDASSEPLGTLSVRNLPGHKNSDGTEDAIQAVLTTDGAAPLTLMTHGITLDGGYATKMLLRSGSDAARLRAESRYQTQACSAGGTTPSVSGQRVAPDCALPLSLDKPHDYTLPSCGLPSYQASSLDTRLTRLTYIKAVAANSSPVALANGARRFDHNGKAVEARLDVLRSGSVTRTSDVRAWLRQTGAGAILGTPAETLLAAAFQDHAWRRFVERKLAEQSKPIALFSTSCGAADGDRPVAAACDNFHWGSDGGKGVSAHGDPHFTSLGPTTTYDFMGEGEYVMARTPAYEIQARMQPRQYQNPPAAGNICTKAVSWISAIAMRLNGQTISMYARQTPHLKVDGQAVADARALAQALKPGVSLTHGGGEYTFTLDNGDRIVITWSGSYKMDIHVSLRGTSEDVVQGLFKAFVRADGTELSPPLTYDQLYDHFGGDWRVKTASQSLFTYAPGQGPNDIYNAHYPTRSPRLSDINSPVRGKVERICENVVGEPQRTWCILDTACASESVDPDNKQFAKLYQGLDLAPARSMTPDDRSVLVEGQLAATHPATLDDTYTADSCRVPTPTGNVVFAEQRGIDLTAPVYVDIHQPGDYTAAGQLSSTTIPSGTKVDVFFVHMPKADAVGHLPGVASVRFTGDILGVAATSATLRGTDDFGDGSLTYGGAAPGRGFEIDAGDSLSISPDKRQLTITSSTPGDVDQLRVFVALPTTTP